MPLNSSVDATTSSQSGQTVRRDAQFDRARSWQRRHEVAERLHVLDRLDRGARKPVAADLRVRLEAASGSR